MINYTSKKQALQLVENATQPLKNRTFLQCNMVGIDWLYVQADEKNYIELTTDKFRKQLRIKQTTVNDRIVKDEVHNVTMPTLQAIEQILAALQEKEVYCL